MRTWTWLYGVLGTVFACLALISFCQGVLGVAPAPALTALIERYRYVVHPPVGWLFSWMGVFLPAWNMPGWLKDLYVLSFVGACGISRAIHDGLRLVREASELRPLNTIQSISIDLLVFACCSIVPLGAIFIPVSLFFIPWTRVHLSRSQMRQDEDEHVFVTWIAVAFVPALAALLGTIAAFLASSF